MLLKLALVVLVGSVAYSIYLAGKVYKAKWRRQKLEAHEWCNE